MYRFLLAPRWIALHVATVLVVAGFVGMGWWQFQTFQLVDDRQARLNEQPVPISELAAPGQPLPESSHGRRVSVSGHYAAEDQVLVPNRVFDRVAGSYVVTPLITADGTAVPVLRGWIHRPSDPGEQPTGGSVTVTGVLVEPEPDTAAQVTPAELKPGQIGYIDSDQLAAQSGLNPSHLYGGFLLLTDESPPAVQAPEPLPTEAVLPGRGTSAWQNFSYWLQWWIFAGAAVVFWASFVRTAVRDRRRAAEAADTAGAADWSSEPERVTAPHPRRT